MDQQVVHHARRGAGFGGNAAPPLCGSEAPRGSCGTVSIAALNRSTNPQVTGTPRRADVATMSLTSTRSRAIGFSTSTGMPRESSSIASCAWVCGGVATIAASQVPGPTQWLPRSPPRQQVSPLVRHPRRRRGLGGYLGNWTGLGRGCRPYHPPLRVQRTADNEYPCPLVGTGRRSLRGSGKSPAQRIVVSEVARKWWAPAGAPRRAPLQHFAPLGGWRSGLVDGTPPPPL